MGGYYKEFKELKLYSGCVDENNVLWFCSVDFNSLFAYDLNKEELTWKGIIPNEEFTKLSLYRNCIKHGHKIYLIPFNAREIAVYDIRECSFKKIGIEDYGVKTQKYFCAASYEQYIYMFGDMTPCILIVDTSNDTVTYFEQLHDELKRTEKPIAPFFLSRTVAVDNELCYLIGALDNSLIILNMLTRHFETMPLGDKSGIYNYMVKDKEKVYLIPGINRRFSVWDLNKKTLKESGRKISEKAQFYSAYISQERLYMLPDRANEICIIDLHDDLLPVTYVGMGDYCGTRGSKGSIESFEKQKFSYVFEGQEKALFYCNVDRTLNVIDKRTDEWRKLNLKLTPAVVGVISDEVNKTNFFTSNENADMVLPEKRIFDLEAFIDLISEA